MKFLARILAVATLVAGLSAVNTQAQNTLPGGVFSPGDLVVYRVGDGSVGLTANAAAVFADEYSTSGTLLGSLEMPTSTVGAQDAFSATGNSTSEGLMTLSADGSSLVLPGYDAIAGASSPATATAVADPRVVGVIGNLFTGPTINTSTALTNVDSTGNIRGVASSNGTSFYITGSVSGPQYAASVGATSAGTLTLTGGPTNTRGVLISGGNLLVSDQSGSAVRISQVGTGLPTVAAGTSSAQTDTALPGTGGGQPSGPYAFTFLTLNGGPNPDTMYVADDLSSSVIKYSLVSGSWVSNGTVAVTAPRGITAEVVGGNVDIFVTAGISTSISNIDEIVDSSGFDATISSNITAIAMVGTGENYRGIAILPIPEPSSIVLVCAGLFGLLAIRRRRS